MTDEAGHTRQVEIEQGEAARAARVERGAGTARLVMRVTGAVAAVALAAAVGLNWYAYAADTRTAADIASGGRSASGEGTAAPVVELEKPAVDLLPSSIIAYETLARHAVPGRGKVAAEALYATLNMELDVLVPISIYANVEGFGSSADARTRLDELMAPQTLRPEDLMLNGVTPARSGFAPDESAWYVGWIRGTYVVYVKTAYKDQTPAEKRDFLRNVSRPVVEAMDTFQRTGRQGLQRAPGSSASGETSQGAQ